MGSMIDEFLDRIKSTLIDDRINKIGKTLKTKSLEDSVLKNYLNSKLF